MKKSKKYVSLALASMLSLGMLTGCGQKNTGTVNVNGGETSSVIYEYTEKPEDKIFDEGEHTFTVVATISENYSKLFEKSVNYRNFEGYKIISTSSACRYGPYFYQFVTYQNTKPVLVSPVYDEYTETYDYSQFGTVIELEDTMSEKTLVK